MTEVIARGPKRAGFGRLSSGILRRLVPMGPLFSATVLITVSIFVVLGLSRAQFWPP
jgi:hypothetical protein